MADSPPLAAPQTLLEWQSLDSYPHERSARWYLCGGILLLAFAAYGLFEGSWSTTLLALSLGGVYFLLRHTPPRKQRVEITALGIRIAGAFTPWHMLRNFWIIEVPPHIELHITPVKFLKAEIVLFLDETDPAAVRELLTQFLPERAGMEERMLDSIARMLKL
jgi:hypothetical protein